MIGKKTVNFILEDNKKFNIPKKLNEFKPTFNNNNLIITYDKNKTSLKKIIEILNENKIIFNEINTHESDLEDVFLDLIKKND